MAAALLMNLARVVGLGAACALIAVYVGVAGWDWAVASWYALMVIVPVLVAVWASITIRPFVLCAVAAFSFVSPFLSFSFGTTVGFVRSIQICSALYLVAAALMLTAIGLRGISDGAGGGNT